MVLRLHNIGEKLRGPIECYLILSCSKKMEDEKFRLMELKEYLSALNYQNMEIRELIEEVLNMK